MNKYIFKFVKSVALGLFVIMAILNVAEAKEVTVDGVGMDRDSALKDARRNAIEQVIGTFVDSRTLVRNAVTEMDQIYLKSAGFVGKIDVLSEGMDNGVYKVRATINVDESPSSELLKQVQAVMALNDPRILVAVFKENTNAHEEAIESAIINKLIDMNFSHIVGSEGTAVEMNARRDVDFAVIARTRTTSTSIEFPDFKGGTYSTGINSGRTELSCKIIRLDTGDTLETFVAEASGVKFGNEQAEREAVKNMADQAGAKVDEKFRKIGAKQQ